jgi:drug/metabolite transporter (DMT)-like permease
MRYKLSVFFALGAIMLGLQYLFLEQPWESFFLPTFWQRIFVAAILATGATWLWFRLRSARQN